MSSLGSGGYRTTTPLLNLSDVVREEISFQRQRASSSASDRSSGASSLESAPAGYSASLIEPVMDDKEVLSTSLKSDRSSVIYRHQEAARIGQHRSKSYGALPSIQHRGGGGGDDFPKKSIEDEFEKIQMRNEAKRSDHATTNFQTFVHVVKGNVGTGLLALPLAVKNAGIILGPVGLFLMGVIATHCMILLLDAANHLCKKNNMNCLNYAEAASVAVGQYTNRQKLIKASGILVNVFLIITQFGFCCVYFVFMAESLDRVFCQAFDVILGKRVWLVILILPVVVFCWIRNLEDLARFSLLANLCILFSLSVIFYEEIYSFFAYPVDERAAIITEPEEFRPFGTVQSIALFFGSVVYAFEGIGMVLPLENKMKTPHHAKPVVYSAMALVTMLYFVFGTTGYIVYGSSIEASITLNLKSSTRLWAAVIFIIARLYFAYAIFASYMLQFYVPMDFLEPILFDIRALDKLTYYFPRYQPYHDTVVRLVFRTLVVILTAIIALAVPDLGDLISLIGAVASSALALIFPALLEVMSFWPERHQRKFLWVLPWQVWVFKDCLIFLLGVAGLALGTYASISNIIQNISKEEGKGCDPVIMVA